MHVELPTWPMQQNQEMYHSSFCGKSHNVSIKSRKLEEELLVKTVPRDVYS